MAYTPRPFASHTCAYCEVVFAARNTRRTYCSPSCNVRASYARNGRRCGPLATTAGLGLPCQVVDALASPVVIGPPSSPVAASPVVTAAPAVTAAPRPTPKPTPAPRPEQAPGYWLRLALQSIDQLFLHRAAEKAAAQQASDRFLERFQRGSTPPSPAPSVRPSEPSR